MIGWPGWLGYAFVIFAGTLTVLTEPVRSWCGCVAARAARSARRDRSRPRCRRPCPSRRAARPAGRPAVARSPTDAAFRPSTAAVPQPRAGGWRGRGAAAITAVAARYRRRRAVVGPHRHDPHPEPARPMPTGMRIALVSDLHLGSITGRDFCRQVVDLVNAQRPDMVLLAGRSHRRPGGRAARRGAADHATCGRPTGCSSSPATTSSTSTRTAGSRRCRRWACACWRTRACDVRGMLVAGVHDIQGAPIGRGPGHGRGAGRPRRRAAGDHDQPLTEPGDRRRRPRRRPDGAGHTHGGQFIPGKWIVALTTPALSGWYEFGRHAGVRVERRGLLGTDRAARRRPRHHDAHAAAGLSRAIDSGNRLASFVLSGPRCRRKGASRWDKNQVFGKTWGRVTDPGPPVRFCWRRARYRTRRRTRRAARRTADRR